MGLGEEGGAADEQEEQRGEVRVKGIWESLEATARERIQQFVQALLEEEFTALMGRRRSERRPPVEEGPAVYRNGYG